MAFYTYTTQEHKEWTAAHAELPDTLQDVYYTPDYHKAFEYNNDGKAICFVFRDQGELYLNCFMVNSVNSLGYKLDRKYLDIQSVYGYAGALSSSDNLTFITSAEKALSEYFAKNQVIAEFSRYHPVLRNVRFASTESKILDRTTVIINLSEGYQALWNNYYSTNARNMVRKAQQFYKADYVYAPKAKDIETFIELYNHSMIKVNAHTYYLFSVDFFFNFFETLKNNLILFTIKDESGSAMCSAIFLHYNKYIHYHLSGRANDSNNSVNSFLIDSAIKFACEHGFQKMHLGGGRSSAPDDSLLKFKKNFSSITGDFFISKKVYHHKVYSDVIQQWETRFPELTSAYKNQLLRYRNVREE